MKTDEVIKILTDLDPLMQNDVVTWGEPDFLDDGDGHIDKIESDQVRQVAFLSTQKDKIIINFSETEEDL